ncbi:MAG: gluconokinase [Crinalium sp.]
MIIIVMGVTGSGKTTIGKQLAALLNWDFYDADSFHSPANIKKMNQGIPLSDADRIPWLLSMQQAIDSWLQKEKNIVLACSGLKAIYRQILARDSQSVRIIYLKGSFELINQRLSNRQNHFMNQELLQSQFDTLEEPTPEESIWIDISQPPADLAQQIIDKLQISF